MRTTSLSRSIWDLRKANALALLALSVASIFYFKAGARVGDGSQYYAMFFAWAETLRPSATDRSGAIYDAYVANHPEKGHFRSHEKLEKMFSLLSQKEGFDFPHFSFYSLLAALYYWPLKVFGADVGLSFNLLHLSLIFIAAMAAHKKLGPLAASCLIVMVISSPALWFINKAHPEFFVVITTTVGIIHWIVGDYAKCGLWFAFPATQYPPFGGLCVLSLAIGLAIGRRQFLVRNWAVIVMTLGILVLHPLYYSLRVGAPSPYMARGSTSVILKAASIKAPASILVDPDIGLVPNWPAALLIVLIFCVLWVKKSCRIDIKIAILLGVAALLFAYGQTRGFTLGRGGSLHISRYALWYIFIIFMALWYILQNINLRRRSIRVFAGLAALGLFIWNSQQYAPDKRELGFEPTALSRFLYSNLPQIYNPLPRIFLERHAGHMRLPKGAWAASNHSGNKILVFPDKMSFADTEDIPDIEGCRRLDPIRVYLLAKGRARERHGNRPFYLNGYGDVLAGPPPSLPEKEKLSFAQEASNDRYLHRGWSSTEPGGAWSDGDSAEIVFGLESIRFLESYRLLLEVEPFLSKQTERTISIYFNGNHVKDWSFRKEGIETLDVRIDGNDFFYENTLRFAIRDPMSPLELHGSADRRKLGIFLRSIRLDSFPLIVPEEKGC